MGANFGRETGSRCTPEEIIPFLLTSVEILVDTTCVKAMALGPKSGPPLHVMGSTGVHISLKT